MRYVTPVPRKSATGLVAAVYAQSAAELGAVFSPHLSPAPDLHAATWAALRESQLAGRAPRAEKEAAAAAVAVANSCPFCVDAHTALIHAAGAHRLAAAVARGERPDDPGQAALVAWAAATRTAAPRAPGALESRAPEPRALESRAPELPAPPYPPELAAEYLGTVLVNHFINRMIDALRPGGLLPANPLLARIGRRLAGLALARKVRRPGRPGLSLSLLTGPAGVPPEWAGDTPIGVAYGALREAAYAGGALLDEPAVTVLRERVARWDGTHPDLAEAWPHEPGLRLALMAALAPYRITDGAVAAWRATHPADADLVRLLAFGAFTAVERIEAGVTAPGRVG